MNKLFRLLIALPGLLLPMLAIADTSLKFTPPPGDYSVVFLGNIFGMVDGILHGTGSQMLGTLFGVFNTAVLTLGGIIIMYTLIVSTMNTAHSGEMLGKQWSSIWVPVRSTIGLALLVPKASGYCMMQIFVMWIIVQGVGAADKIWDAALGYLNRGGAIITAQSDPTKKLLSQGGAEIAAGAQAILAGQVCMLGLQQALQMKYEENQADLRRGAGACAGAPSENMKKFCDNPVPDFINSVSPVAEAQRDTGGGKYNLPMPNFPNSSAYSTLNGICGTIVWDRIDKKTMRKIMTTITSLSQQDKSTIQMSRAIAVQQLYSNLSLVAQVIVGNNPLLMSRPPVGANKPFTGIAQQQFGIPLLDADKACKSTRDDKCYMWGQVGGSRAKGAPILMGTEFQGAIADYNNIMASTLNLAKQADQGKAARANRAFIKQASNQGWVMAGSYFFNLVRLNQAASDISNKSIDDDSGLNESKLPNFKNDFSGKNCEFCEWLGNDKSKIKPIIAMVRGADDYRIGGVVEPTKFIGKHPSVLGNASSTVYGYTANATVLRLPGQPGYKPMHFSDNMIITPDVSQAYLERVDFDCGEIMFVCVGAILGNVFYNAFFVTMFNTFMAAFGSLLDQAIQVALEIPLQGMITIFQAGLAIIARPDVNPIVALANMGTYYINFAGNLWKLMLGLTIASMMSPFGAFIMMLFAMAAPITFSWLGVMVAIGFITAYYIPILPYMIFTLGTLAWLMVVIEAMVAAPIVALGITHPEGHEAFGKGEHAVMILLNVFLRPSMMIIGYIAAITLSYVSVWLLNAGFDNAISFIQDSTRANAAIFGGGFKGGAESTAAALKGSAQGFANTFSSFSGRSVHSAAGSVQGGYLGWAGIFAIFFSMVAYTGLYLTVVEKSFSLISTLPDKVLRWLGAPSESASSEAAQWLDQAKGHIKTSGEATEKGLGQTQKAIQAQTGKLAKGAGGGGGGARATPGGGKPSGGEGGDGESLPSPGGGEGGGGGGGGKGAGKKVAAEAAGMSVGAPPGTGSKIAEVTGNVGEKDE